MRFHASYRERYGVEEALIDAAQFMVDGDAPLRARVYRLEKDTPDILRAKFYVRGDVLALVGDGADPGKSGAVRVVRAEFPTHARRRRSAMCRKSRRAPRMARRSI